ncbi:MAG: glyoxylate/hydroxypyruvate reductase A [Proteobacteria bacterium]|nr:glyoxylate/hydroxypyruvate reductase A [Pseudomonadota bacterium]
MRDRQPLAAVYIPNTERVPLWVDHLSSLLPGWDVRASEAFDDPARVDYAVVWKPPAGLIARFPNLKATVSIGAGVDHILADPLYPRHIPIIKTVGDDLTQRMREYVALHVLRFHRELPALEQANVEAQWRQIIVPPATRRKVGIMGLGPLGRAAAKTLIDLGFQVSGWSKRGAHIQGLRSFTGTTQLEGFLDKCEILVCLLPLTPETQGILNAELFAALPRKACIINAARGQHLVEDDLLHALETGHIASATLDVFKNEPLPPDHAFWSHPNILVTPHVASLIDPASGGEIIASNLRRFEETGTAPHIADCGRGY